jgi:hypothetical protein
MKHIKTYMLFEGTNKNILYRTTVYEWLIDFLKKGFAVPTNGKKFISFSKDENSGMGESDEFGDIKVDFDAFEILRQGGQEVKYDEKFFEENPDICFYVTGYKNKKDYERINPPDMTNELTWKETIKSFSGEKEIVIKKIKYKPNLIKEVTIWNADERDDLQKIKKTLLGYKLKVKVPWEE